MVVFQPAVMKLELPHFGLVYCRDGRHSRGPALKRIAHKLKPLNRRRHTHAPGDIRPGLCRYDVAWGGCHALRSRQAGCGRASTVWRGTRPSLHPRQAIIAPTTFELHWRPTRWRRHHRLLPYREAAQTRRPCHRPVFGVLLPDGRSSATRRLDAGRAIIDTRFENSKPYARRNEERISAAYHKPGRAISPTREANPRNQGK